MSTTRKGSPSPWRKKPLVVGAMRWVPDDPSSKALLEWIREGGATYELGTDLSLSIDTHEGTMKASPGDWVIREPSPTSDRLFYPCKPDIFEATYEPAEMKYAQLVEIDPRVGVRVDGELFPWYVAEDAAVEVHYGKDTIVRLGLLTERFITASFAATP